MNVLFVSNDPSIFIQGSAARERMQAYAEAIGELHIISRAPRGAREEVEGSLHLHAFRGGRLMAFFFMSDAARTLIKKHGIEVVSAQDPFEHGAIALEACKGTEAKLHIQIHTDFLSPWFTRSGNPRALKLRVPLINYVRRMFADAVLPKAEGIRVVSKRIQESLVARYGNRIKEVSVLPVGLPSIPPSAVPLPEHGFSFAFITVSRLEPEKRIEDIFMALACLGPRLHSVGLIIVGEGSERKKLEVLAGKLGLRERVVFLGERRDAWGLMRSAQAYIQASAYEGYGRTLIEAALARIPIITTDVGIVGEVFKGYEHVLSVPPADPVNLVAQMYTLIEDHQLRLKLVMSAEKVAREHLVPFGDQPRHIAEDFQKLVSRTP